MRAYLAELNQIKREVENLREAQTHPDLRARFLAWYNGLPEVSRYRPFAILEIEQALHTQGKYLSPVMISLGWQRKRKWDSKGHYPRYWIPPNFYRDEAY